MTMQPNNKCTCPSGDGSLRWPCPKHPAAAAPVEPKSPSYDGLLLMMQSVCGALSRAGLNDCDDPGEAIDVIRERLEKRVAELERQLLARTPAAPGIDRDAVERLRNLADYAGTAGYPSMGGDIKALLGALDASPKGALNEQFGSAEGLSAPEDDGLAVRRVADHMAQVIDYIGKRYPDAALLDRGPILRNIRQWEKRLRAVLMDSPKGGSDPWRGLYASERMPNRDEYGCFYHPDIPSWDDEREESIAPLLKAQGFELQCVPGDFSDEAMEEGGERYWQEMREWNPEPEGDGWRLVSIYDTEDGPYAMFVKPLALASDAEVQP